MEKFKRTALGGKENVKQILLCRRTPRKMARRGGQEAKCTFAMFYSKEANAVLLLSL